ncbi:MAG: hypothetical protein KDA73_13320 [Rhodobacteraceae bacterium]|nr:hypothetical protein [Paracoccaceae bacterium]
MPIKLFAALIMGVIVAGALSVAAVHAAGGAGALAALLPLAAGVAWLLHRSKS